MSTAKKKETGGLDIQAAQALIDKEEAGVVIEIRGPDWLPLMYEGKPVTVTVYGSYAPTFQKLNDEFERSFVASRTEGLTGEAWSQAFKDARRDMEAERDKQVRARTVKEWYGFLDGGTVLEPTPDNVMRFMGLAWFAPQIRQGQDRHEGFSGTASGS